MNLTKKIYLFYLIVTFGFLSFSCSKKENIVLRWDQTGCSNPWDEFIELDTFTVTGYHQGIIDYLISENINLIQVWSEFDSSKVELCYACHCKTGEIIQIEVPKKDERKLRQLTCNNQFGLQFY